MQNTVRCTTKEVELSVSHRQSFKTETVRDMDIPPYIENKADVIVREDLQLRVEFIGKVMENKTTIR